MQGMFSRALGQIERQRVHLGQSGLSTTDIKRWLLQHGDLAQLADGAIEQPVLPLFATPAEMIDVAETELLAARSQDDSGHGLPPGQDAPMTNGAAPLMPLDLDDWLQRLADFSHPGWSNAAAGAGMTASLPVHESLLPASFALASYRASLLPLLGGDAFDTSLAGATAQLARLPIAFVPTDVMIDLQDPHVAAISVASLSLDPFLRLSFDLSLDPAPASAPGSTLTPTPVVKNTDE
jgi:hypothetical protein